ncbi:MAG: site-specific integrase [Synechococcaceae cyanobacterium SM1_2_3]|nr:site-specific integrase [Synechococcaceae cyanobacterium SM1_2_3]
MSAKRLTRLDFRRLQPGQQLTSGGIHFERLANGDGRYAVNIMVDRVRIHRIVGLESEGVTLTQAEQLIEQLRTEARASRLNLPKGRKVALGFSMAADDYLKRLDASQGRNMGKKRLHIALHLKPFFADKSLSKIEKFDLQRYAKQRRGNGAAPGTINREFATLLHLYKRAVEWGWLDKVPFEIPRQKEENRRMVYLTSEQISALLSAAKADRRWELYPFILIALHTAMRLNEILSIRRADIDLARRIIHIPQAKAGARDQPITVELADYLREVLAMGAADQVWLFPANSASGHTVEIAQAFQRVVTAAGLNPREVIQHTLRHTAITHLVQSGVDLPTVQRISGHKTLAMVARYSHQNGEHIQAAMEQLQNRITQELHRPQKSLTGT